MKRIKQILKIHQPQIIRNVKICGFPLKQKWHIYQYIYFNAPSIKKQTFFLTFAETSINTRTYYKGLLKKMMFLLD